MPSRRGFSLIIVLALMLALLFVGASFSNSILHATRTSRLGWQGDQSARSADAALLGSLDTWDRVSAATLRTGETDTVLASGDASASSRVTRTRLNARTFLLVASAQQRDGAMRRTQRENGLVVQLNWPTIPARAAITTSGAITISDSATLLGTDAEPAGWADECANDRATSPTSALVSQGAIIAAGAIVAGRGSGTMLLTTSDAATLAQEIADAVAAVAATATIVTADSVLDADELVVNSTGDACPRWFGAARRGAPGPDACERRWPVVSATSPGVTRLTGDTPVQGVLVVAGDLHIDDGVQFSGLLLVSGAVLRTAAPSPSGPAGGAARAQVVGAMVIRDRANAGSHLEEPILVQASRCSVRLALAALGNPAPVRQHGWSARP